MKAFQQQKPFLQLKKVFSLFNFKKKHNFDGISLNFFKSNVSENFLTLKRNF